MNELGSETNQTLKSEAIRGTFWNYVSFAAGKGLRFITTIILARLLVPAEFGLIGYATIAIQYLDIMNSAGVSSALIARRDKLEEAANSAFIANIIMGILSFGVAWFAAPYIAQFFKAEEVTGIFRLLAVSLPISGLGLVPDALLQRSLQFRTKLIPDVSRTFVKGMISIVLALMGWGVMALVWGQIIGEIVGVVLSWILVAWRPSRKFDHQVTREVMIFGAHIIVIEFVGALRSNVDYLVIGRVLGATALGLYTMAYRFPELAIQSMNHVVGRVSFPLLASVQSDKKSLSEFFYGYIRHIALFTFPVGFGIALISNLFVSVFLSSAWEQAIIPMALISIALAISSIGYVPGVLYKAMNRPDILQKVSLIRLPFIVAAVLYGARWGLLGVALGQIAFAIFSVSLDSVVVSRIVQFRLMKIVQAIAPAALATVAMVAILAVLQLALSPSGILGLISLVLAGATTYLAVLALVNRSIFLQAYSSLRGAFIRS